MNDTHETTKSILQSATFWVNLGMGLVAAADWLLANQYLLSGFVTPETMTMIMAVVNIILRFRTKQPVALKLPA